MPAAKEVANRDGDRHEGAGGGGAHGGGGGGQKVSLRVVLDLAGKAVRLILLVKCLNQFVL